MGFCKGWIVKANIPKHLKNSLLPQRPLGSPNPSQTAVLSLDLCSHGGHRPDHS